MVRVHHNSSLWIVGIKKGTAAPSQAVSTTRACQQVHPFNKSCGTELCLLCRRGAEGERLWSSSWVSARVLQSAVLQEGSQWFSSPGSTE